MHRIAFNPKSHPVTWISFITQCPYLPYSKAELI